MIVKGAFPNMVDRALTDLAEAALGGNREMRWSLSTDVLRRQILPVFQRCAEGGLTAEQSLDVAMDFVEARVSNVTAILSTLFQTLEERLAEQLEGVKFENLGPLEEFFMGLNSEADWVTDQNIARKELYPLFVRVAVGKLDIAEGLVVFCDNIEAKRDYYLELIRVLVVHLAEEIRDREQVTPVLPEENGRAVSEDE